MKGTRSIGFYNLFAAIVAALWVSVGLACTQLPTTPESDHILDDGIMEEPGARPVVQAENSPKRPVDPGLEDKTFSQLPREAKKYLAMLSSAFSSADMGFLIRQGEVDYERRIKPHWEAEEYLALLYRIGPYAADTPATSGPPPRLVPKEFLGIRYTGWDEAGPLLEIRGRLIPAKGNPLPCRIILLWRLEDPKILGIEP